MNIRTLSILTCTALLLASMIGSAAAGKLKFINFDVPGARDIYVLGLSDSNTVAGYYEDASDFLHGFIRQSDGTIVSYDGPGALETFTTGINAADQVVGYFYDQSSVSHGYVRDPNGTIAVVDFPGADYTAVEGVNNKGDVTGEFEDQLGYHGFLEKRTGKFKQFNVPGAGTAGVLINDVAR